jgi:hypothetical protein
MIRADANGAAGALGNFRHRTARGGSSSFLPRRSQAGASAAATPAMTERVHRKAIARRLRRPDAAECRSRRLSEFCAVEGRATDPPDPPASQKKDPIARLNSEIKRRTEVVATATAFLHNTAFAQSALFTDDYTLRRSSNKVWAAARLSRAI